MSNIIALVRALSQDTGGEPEMFLSSGYLPLDYAMGGGFALPKATVVGGKTHSGKTCLSLNAIACLQRKYQGIGLFYNAEEAPVEKRARQLGVDTSKWILRNAEVLDSYYLHPDRKVADEYTKGFFEDARDVIARVREAGFTQPILTVLDSVTMTPNARECLGKGTRGEHAAVMSRELRGFNKFMNRMGAGLILVNHLTIKQDESFGKKTTFLAEAQQSGYAVVTVELDRTQWFKDGSGQMMRAVVTKNKLTGQRIRTTEFPVYYTGGVPYLDGCVEFLAMVSPRKGFIKLKDKFFGKKAILEKAQYDSRLGDMLIRQAEDACAEMSARLRSGEPAITEGEKNDDESEHEGRDVPSVASTKPKRKRPRAV